MAKNNDGTNKELCELLEVATGVKVGKSTMVRITQKFNYSLKKLLLNYQFEVKVWHKFLLQNLRNIY
ncbi:MAG: hypothetical protein F6K22_39325 [Okeania sp. SIO2F4]|uniref:hypothetical protein n=1 Tax=Okeania sp. SIO2F4 TaxID=2607790 RepID=UPI00142A879A|nr:hypothetical protein [Okeania sp. SIO2F4]NES08286.1 hypothetical protein [Okeania sp. SIO2F4]